MERQRQHMEHFRSARSSILAKAEPLGDCEYRLGSRTRGARLRSTSLVLFGTRPRPGDAGSVVSPAGVESIVTFPGALISAC